MELSIESITPKKAEKYLESNFESQRHLTDSNILRIAEAIESNEFDGMNGDTLKFRKNGDGWVLVDGQHRLHAVVLSGKAVKMAVLRGVSTDSFITLDQGKPRNVANYWQIANMSHAALASQVAKWNYYRKFGGNPLSWKGKGAVPIPGLVATWGIEHCADLPALIDRVNEFLCAFPRKHLGMKSHLAYCYYQWEKIDPINAHEYCKYFGTGEGDVPKTIRSAREYLLELSAKNQIQALPGSKRATQVISTLNSAWNLTGIGKKNLKKFSLAMGSYNKKLDKIKQGSDLAPIEPQ